MRCRAILVQIPCILVTLCRDLRVHPRLTLSSGCAPFTEPIMIYFPFGSAVRKLSTVQDYIQGAKSAPKEPKQGPPKNTFF